MGKTTDNLIDERMIMLLQMLKDHNKLLSIFVENWEMYDNSRRARSIERLRHSLIQINDLWRQVLEIMQPLRLTEMLYDTTAIPTVFVVDK